MRGLPFPTASGRPGGHGGAVRGRLLQPPGAESGRKSLLEALNQRRFMPRGALGNLALSQEFVLSPKPLQIAFSVRFSAF